jgi:CheY-like chemotaxis protein
LRRNADDRGRIPLNRTVLVVEDDSAIREVLSLAVGEDTAVVVLDLMLPETDGFQVARRLRSDARTTWTWIIAIRAAGAAMEAAARNAGCDEFVP